MTSATIQSRAEAEAWQAQHNPHAPKVGDPAPDFTLADIRGEQRVRLADLRGQRPVALIFGSFT